MKCILKGKFQPAGKWKGALLLEVAKVVKRDKSIDIIRGIAIFFVLWGHCIQSIAGDEGFFSNWVIRLIYSFHMPLFMIISGYLFHRTCQKDFLTVLKEKLIALGIPFIVWNGLLYLRKCLFALMNTHSFVFDFSEMATVLFSGLWFLKSLFIITILTYFVMRGCKRFRYIVCMVAWISLIASSNVVGEHTADLFPFFIMGFLLAEYKKLYEQIEKYQYAIYVLYIVMLIGMDNNCFVYVSGINPITSSFGFFKQMWFNVYRIVIGAAGGFAVIVLVKRTYTKWARSIERLFEALGQNTLQIYVVQSLILERVLSRIVNAVIPTGGMYAGLIIQNFLIAPTAALLYAVVILLVVRGVKQVPTLSMVLFGDHATLSSEQGSS